MLAEPLSAQQSRTLQQTFDESLGRAFRYSIRAVERLSRRQGGEARTLDV